MMPEGLHRPRHVAGIRLEKADESIFDDLHRDLLVPYFQNPSITREMWRQMFSPPWERVNDYSGFALMDGSEVVGFVGTIFAEVAIDGRPQPFCNISSWVVHRDYRRHSLRVLSAIEELKDHTMTAFTPIPVAAKAYKMLGFQVLDTTQIVGVHGRARARSTLGGGGFGSAPRTITDPVEIGAWLRPHDRKVFEDHRTCPCGHLLLVEADGAYCYVMSNVAARELPLSELLTRRERLLLRLKARLGHDPHRVNQVLFVSHPDLFARRFEHLVRALYGKTRVRLTVVDRRIVGDRPIAGVEVPLVPEKLYWPTSVPPERIQNHYSELALFGL